MITLSYTVAGQLIEPASVPQYLVADTVGVYQVAFTFDTDWADMGEKTVVFRNPQVIDPDYRDVPVEFPLDANGQALVPAALLDPGKLFIGVYGTNSTQQFPTIWAPPLQVVPGASPGVEPSDDPALGTVIRTIPQTLTEEEKAQARENIGANEVADGTPGNVVIIDNNLNITDSGKSLSDIYDAAMISKTASGGIVTIEDGADYVPVKEMTVQIVPVQDGSGNPSPSNVRTITGWTEAEIKRYRRNLLYDTDDGDAYRGITMTRNADGSYHISGTPTIFITGRLGIIGRIPVQLPPGTYTVSVNSDFAGTGTSTYRVFFEYHVPGTDTWNGSALVNGATSRTIETDGIRNFRLQIYQTNITLDITIKPQIETGSVKHDFESYISDCVEIPITFPTEAGTVYGGSLTVRENGTGTLTVTWAEIDLSTVNTGGIISNNYIFYTELNDPLLPPNNSTIAHVLAEKYVPIRYGGVATTANTLAIRTNKYLYVNTGSQSTLPSGKAIYEVATPVVYQLTAPQVSTLLGLNNLWADTGDISITYRADPTLATAEQAQAIKESIAYYQTDYTAKQAYVVNDLVYVEDALYIVTSAIAQGATMTPNTNCSQTTLNAVIKSLR